MITCIRTHLGLSIEDFARSLGVPEALIATVEGNPRNKIVPRPLANAIYTVYGYDTGTDIIAKRSAGARIRMLRGDMTIHEFVNYTGVAAIGLFEHGKAVPGDIACKRIAERCGVDESWILFGFGRGPDEKRAPKAMQDEEPEDRTEKTEIQRVNEGRRMRGFRQSRQMTQYQLGQLLGVGQGQISQYERGMIAIPDRLLEQLEKL